MKPPSNHQHRLSAIFPRCQSSTARLVRYLQCLARSRVICVITTPHQNTARHTGALVLVPLPTGCHCTGEQVRLPEVRDDEHGVRHRRWRRRRRQRRQRRRTAAEVSVGSRVPAAGSGATCRRDVVVVVVVVVVIVPVVSSSLCEWCGCVRARCARDARARRFLVRVIAM